MVEPSSPTMAEEEAEEDLPMQSITMPLIEANCLQHIAADADTSE